MRRKLKAMGVAILGTHKGVHFKRKARVMFNGLSRRLARLASLFYDVRRSRDGHIFFQLRDLDAERKTIKRFRKHIGRLGA